MGRFCLESRKQKFRFRLEHRSFVIWAGESADGVERIEKVDHDVFDFVARIAAQQVSAAIAGDFAQARKHFVFEQFLIRCRVFRFGPTPPMPSDHEGEFNTSDFSEYRCAARPPIFKFVTWLLILLLQDPEAIRTAMENSLAAQRASVQKQAQSLGVSIPWTTPVLVSADCDPVPQSQLSKMIDEVSEKQGVGRNLVREVARQESAFRPCAVSDKGAQGLMQLMPETQTQFHVADPFDAKQSLEGGTKLLKQLLDRYGGDLTKALGAYNAGTHRVDEAAGVPDIAETQNYIFSILNRFLK